MKYVFAFLLATLGFGCVGARKLSGDLRDSSAGAGGEISESGGAASWQQVNLGVELGRTVPDTLVWKGYGEGKNVSDVVDIATTDWYDPDGSRGIDAVLVVTTKHGCKSCIDEAVMLQNKMTAWASQGRNIKVVVLLVNSAQESTPQLSDAYGWKVEYFLIDAAVGIDPISTFAPDVVFAWPYHTVIDPRLMRVVATQEGIISDYKDLESLADSNK